MNLRCRFTLVAGCIFASLASVRGLDSAPPGIPATPASLAAPADQEPFLVLTARGVQIYECRAVAGDANKFEWAFKAPEAELFDAQGRKVGRHYAGPTWELNVGGKVVGHLKAKADAPDGKGVAWLLLDVASREGNGLTANVQSIQRVATVGGKPPTEVADQPKMGQERRVEYTATYVFYTVSPQGK